MSDDVKELLGVVAAIAAAVLVLPWIAMWIGEYVKWVWR